MGFLLHDILGIVCGAVVLALMLLLPGFGLGEATDVAGFRAKGDGAKWMWAVLLSFAIVPEVVYLAARVGGLGLAAACVLLMDAWAAVCVVRSRGAGLRWTGLRWGRLVGAFAVGLCVIAALLVDVPWHGRLYVSSVVLDQAYRVAFVRTLAMHGLPAVNPLNFPGSAQPLHYYYFWYLVCALPVRLLGLDARCVLVASSAWSLLGLCCGVTLLARRVFADVRVARVSLMLLMATGLDVLVVFANHLSGDPLDIDPEWWSRDQVTSWADSVLWVPHHLGALAVAVCVLLLLWPGERRGWRTVAVAGCAMASCFGMSAYVGLALVLLMAAWMAVRWLQGERGLTVVRALVASGVVVLPLVLEMRGGAGGGGLPLKLGVRELIASDIVGVPTGPHAELLKNGAKLLLLPLGYLVELGFFLIAWIVAAVRWRGQRGDRRELLTLAAIAFAICTFLRSTAIHNNDFGYRAALVMQVLLLVISAAVVVEWMEAGRRWGVVSVCAALALCAGLAGTAYQMVWLRVYAAGSAGRAETARDLRVVYAALRGVAKDAVVQWEPPVLESAKDQRARVEHALHLLYSPRWVAATDPDCGVPFGGDGMRCAALQRDIAALAEGVSADEAMDVCRRWGISYLVATESEAAWVQRDGWVWRLRAVGESPKARVLDCQTNSR